ncbi:MAG: hypothetical protein D0433_00510 [Candidatus Thermochlorobacter aerophilum]|jgi:hypothetical protein|uniref:Uncharacterized protein n=1 Tax=Candidatus Thermochlorobacter aerophilus TaxID=1868324 RepID=A0A395M5W0_9BACT|nr:MAG: hypothetical protein D0433_01575 [Candidatus Thermochlorobacter aerophilum]RFM25544.1 MAG: hypothetical protein D0433_00510 [Candidatus Thermochlorobacter aerophilum]
MKILSYVLLLIGLVGIVVGSIRYSQQTEWEHWAPKLVWLSVLGSSIFVTGIGVVIFLAS